MSAHLITQLRRYVGRSPVLQILFFMVIVVVVLLLAEYSGIFPG